MSLRCNPKGSRRPAASRPQRTTNNVTRIILGSRLLRPTAVARQLLGSMRRFVEHALVRRFLNGPGRWPQPFPYALKPDVQRRDRKNADERGEDHATENRRTDIATRQLRGTACDDQWV